MGVVTTARTGTQRRLGARLRRLGASGPFRFVCALAIVAVATSTVVRRAAVEAPRLDAAATIGVDPGPGALDVSSPDRFVAVIEVAELTPDLVAGLDRATARAGSVAGIRRARSVTNTNVLVTEPPFESVATPAFGSRSSIGHLPLDVRVLWTARSRLDARTLLAPDGRTLLIDAEYVGDRSAAALRAAGDGFRAAVDAEMRATHPTAISYGGPAFERIAAHDEVRTDLVALVALAIVVPGLAGLVLLRRLVPTSSILAAGGTALLAASIVVGQGAGGSRVVVSGDDAARSATARAASVLGGSVPFEIRLQGAPGTFRDGTVLTRVDAMAAWLADEYGVALSGEHALLRDMAATVTAVDPIPPNQRAVDDLLADAERFGGTVFLRNWVSSDYSTVRLTGWIDGGDADEVHEMTRRLGIIGAHQWREHGIEMEVLAHRVDLGTDVIGLQRNLIGLGIVALGLALASAALRALCGGAQAAGVARDDVTAVVIDLRDGAGAAEPASLFARAHHEVEPGDGPGPGTDAPVLVEA